MTTEKPASVKLPRTLMARARTVVNLRRERGEHVTIAEYLASLITDPLDRDHQQELRRAAKQG